MTGPRDETIQMSLRLDGLLRFARNDGCRCAIVARMERSEIRDFLRSLSRIALRSIRATPLIVICEEPRVFYTPAQPARLRPPLEKPSLPYPVIFRRYQTTDYGSVASLWRRINLQLAPAGMEELFERYIAVTIDGELKQLAEVFSKARRNAFWVVEGANEIVGTFGIESHGISDTELRRMYLDEGYRGSGIAQRMLDCAQTQARAFGFTRMILSTAQIQSAAEKFYRKSGFVHLRTEVAETMTTKQAGGGLTRLYFEKML